MRRAAAAVLAPVALAGCGAVGAATDNAGDFKGDQKAVAQVVDDLAKAGAKRDGKEVCTTVLAAPLRRRALGDCPKVLHDQLSDADVFKLDVQKVAVSGDRATATVKPTGGATDERVRTLRFVREGRAWRLAGLG